MRAMGFGVGEAKNVIIDVTRDTGGYMGHIKLEKVPAGSTSEVAFGEKRKESRASCGQFLWPGIGELASDCAGKSPEPHSGWMGFLATVNPFCWPH